jgi:hypothetical protein
MDQKKEKELCYYSCCPVSKENKKIKKEKYDQNQTSKKLDKIWQHCYLM